MGKKYDLTSPQKSIWYTEEVFKGTTVNNICTTGIIYEKINEDLLKQAINNVVKQNDSFRIHLTLENGIVKQYISDYEKFDINIEFIDNASKLKKIEESESKYLFNLIDSNLFKFKIVILKNKFAAVILTANHIISDSWSMGITIQEILRNYHCLLNKGNPNIDTFSYLDYIASEEKYLNSKKYEADRDYWQKEFETIPEQATIPSLNQNSSSLSNIAKRFSFELDKKFVNKINDFCKNNHFSLFAFFMSVYSVYISRVSNTDDFVIGTPILNRTNMKEKHTTGMFINTAPVRVNTHDSGAFCDFVTNLSQKILGILRHQKYSYNRIIEDLRKENKNLANLYNIMISYQITKAFNEDFGNYKTNWTFNNYSANDMDIHITDINDTGKLTINYDYLVDKYSEKDIKDLHMRIVYIIEQILSNSNISLDDIEIVTKQERDIILNTFNNTTKEYPKNKTIIDLFEEQVEKTPDNIAVVFENEKLTYKELNKKANSLANFLISKGLKKNNTVSIFLDKSLESIIAILSILKCGCSYMPIDINYPIDRISYMLENSNSQFILTTNNLKLRLETLKNYVFVDLSNKKVFGLSNDNVVVPSNSDSLAYVMYTSGSTGKPKGVMVTNRNVVRLVKNTNFISFEENERILQTGSIVFDACTFEIWGALLNGFELYIIKKEDLLDPYSLQNYLIKNKITILWVTAPLFNQLSENNPKMFGSCRVLLTGGDVLSPKHINMVRNSCPNLTIINGYGPTENTTFSTCFTIDKNYSSSIPIGYPIANSTCYVVSKNLKLLPIGVPGELLVGGDGVSKGYLNNPSVTSEKFISNIFGDGKLYKTGDLVRWNKNGSIDFIGRIDNQVKIRGFRVEINEITLTIQKYKDINECVVVVREINGEKVLCSYFSSDVEINIKALKSFLEKLLPYYAIPTYFVQLDSLPINANGKIDRNKLPIIKYKKINSDKNIVLPRNDSDLKLINILRSLLDIDNISIDDNFFELGGDSLSAINYSSHIQNIFGVKIFVKDILDHPTVKELSDIINSKQSESENISIKNVPKLDSYPVSSAQKRIYFTCQMAGNDSILYNIPGGVILDGLLDTEKLNNCFNTLIKRHESLRTYFELNNDNVVQKIIDNYSFNLDILNNCNYEDLDTLFKEFVKPFDLSKAPLLRAKLIEFTNRKSAIFIDMHHIISDGSSLAIFTDELCKLYNDEKLPELNITYKDYSYFEHEQIENGKLDDAEKYWLNQFESDIPILNMPTSYPRPIIRSYDGKKLYASIDENLTQKIEKLANKLEITPYMLLLSCYYILLSKYANQEDIIVGSPIIGRNISDIYNVIGMFVNTLALRAKVDENISFKNFVLNIKENVLNAYKYQTYPFDELVSKLNIKRDTSRNPLFDTMFIYQNNGYKSLDLKNIKSSFYTADQNISKFDISVEVIPNNNHFDVSFEYSTGLFNEQFITDLSEHYLNIINCILDNADINISDISMLSDEEKNTILYNFNNTFVDYQKNKTISNLFEEQVEKTPDNIAIVFQNQKLTYRELNNKSNSLAHFLRDNKKIGRNDIVGIMCNRSLEMIIAILAVLKSGAAYIPIDPTYPKERIDYMLSNCNSKLLLTQRNIETVIDFEGKLFIDLFNTDIYSLSNNNLDSINKPEDMSYIIFTSGSTGKPKGVMLTHKALSNLTNYCNNYVEYLKNPEYKSVVSITTVSFDIFIFETLISLQKGLRLIIADESEQNTPHLLNELMLKNDVKIIQSTPSRMQIFIDNISSMPSLKDLEYITLAGEQLPLVLVEKIHEISNAVIYNGYGPSETTVFSTLTKIDSDRITIGKPLDNTQIYILNNKLHPVPIYVPGEIYISGDGVGKGYVNNIVLTNKSFIKNPFVDNAIMYKTGDIGYYNPDGTISCLGRIDNQVKIRGLRIELGEIESLILKYPHIKNVCVIKQVLNNREFISAYFISDKKIQINGLRKYLAESLPRYMVPSYFIMMSEFPYTPNGKIDKKSLPLPKEILTINQEQYVPPKTDLQKQLVSIWEKILNTKPIGINDNFFELGGDSLLAMNLSIELLKITPNIKYVDIFRFPTIQELEEKINTNNELLYFNKIENLSDSFAEILKNNTKKTSFEKWHPRNILLTGCTGFLGMHVLERFLRKEKGNIYCIVRDEPGITSKTRLYQKLNYYFGNKYNNLIGKRIFALTGNITEPGFGMDQDNILLVANSIDVVINCAATVSHYGNYNDFYNTNVKSVKYMIDFCKSFNKKLYHVSTMSVSGTNLDTSYPAYGRNSVIPFRESCLYVGQTLENVYARSKFEAECLVLNAIANGLDGYILRMGNLMPRFKDGFFQENFFNNAFMNKIIAFIKIGGIPDYLEKEYLEFTPVDYAANAIYKLITHPNKNNRIFHLYNHNYISLKKLLKRTNKAHYNIKVFSESDFKEKVKDIINSNNSDISFNYLLNDFNKDLHLNYKYDIIAKSEFTIKYLRKTLFRWPKLTNRYLTRFINILRKVI